MGISVAIPEEANQRFLKTSAEYCLCVLSLLFIFGLSINFDCYGATTGTLKWSYATEGPIHSSPAIGSDGTVYVGCYDHKLYAINNDGTLKWSYTTGYAVESSPAIRSDGTVYIGSDDNRLYAINGDGTLKWSYATGYAVRSTPAIGSDCTVYVGSDDNKLYAINSGGTLKWSYATGGAVRSSPAIGSDGTVYAGSDDGKLYAISSDGTLKWSYATGGKVYSSPAIGSDGTVYVGYTGSYTGLCNNKLYAINGDGTLKWSYTTSFAGGGSTSCSLFSPVIGGDGTVYVGFGELSQLPSYHSDVIYGRLFAVNGDGTFKWSYTTGSYVESTPAIGSDGTVYAGSDDGKLYAINSDGILKWSYATGGIVYSSPAISSDGTVYVGSYDNKLYAFYGGTVPANSQWPTFMSDNSHSGRAGASASSCSYTLGSYSQSMCPSAGTGSVVVTPSSCCAWTAASNVSWITITSGSSGTGGGTVNYSVSANTSGSSRTGTLTIAGQTFTVMQSASITHYLTAPSTTLVSRGSIFGPITSSITNTTSLSCSLNLYASVYTPKGSWVDYITTTMTISAGQSVSNNNNIIRLIPALADTGTYYFCEGLYDTSWNLIDFKCVSFTVQ
ncbi:MAG: PQQ-binding-like beta-propeller repeat protein [Nitrospirae bacterium]|nr:PQQ-binding-like beta-propeller repeat protein [Nitrospirota bacterium]